MCKIFNVRRRYLVMVDWLWKLIGGGGGGGGGAF